MSLEERRMCLQATVASERHCSSLVTANVTAIRTAVSVTRSCQIAYIHAHVMNQHNTKSKNLVYVFGIYY